MAIQNLSTRFSWPVRVGGQTMMVKVPQGLRLGLQTGRHNEPGSKTLYKETM